MSSPYARALSDHWKGVANATYEIHRGDGFRAAVLAANSFAAGPFEPLEELALEQARGRIADVGAGVGRHTLALQARDARCMVTAIEAEPDLVEIMKARGVVDDVDFDELRAIARAAGWSAESLAREPSGHHLARLY